MLDHTPPVYIRAAIATAISNHTLELINKYTNNEITHEAYKMLSFPVMANRVIEEAINKAVKEWHNEA